MMYGWWGSGWGSIGWTLMCVVITLSWIGVITAIVLAALYGGGSRNSAGPPSGELPPPEDVRSERVDSGDTGRDEHRRRMSIVRKPRADDG